MKKLVTWLSLSTLMLLTTNLSLAGGGKHTGKAAKSLHKLQMKNQNKENLKRRQAPNRKQEKSGRKSKQSTPELQRAVQYAKVDNDSGVHKAIYGMD